MNDHDSPILDGERPGSTRPVARPGSSDGDIRVVDRRWWARADAGDAGEAVSDKPTYVQELEQRLAQKDEELRSTIARYREASAEFDEARVRFRREVAREVERGKRGILAELLEVVDNLDRAVDAARQRDAGGPLLSGVEMIRSQFLAKLDAVGVRRLDAENHAFDPVRHEAVTTVPVPDPAADGRIVGVIRHGYLIGDEVLRPALVAVARLAEGADI
jgi:molecular chaperone GrpE